VNLVGFFAAVQMFVLWPKLIIFRHCSYSVKSATIMDTCFNIGIFDRTEIHTCVNVEDCFLLHLSFYFIS